MPNEFLRCDPLVSYGQGCAPPDMLMWSQSGPIFQIGGFNALLGKGALLGTVWARRPKWSKRCLPRHFTALVLVRLSVIRQACDFLRGSSNRRVQ